jgi:hypothetical protein
VFGWLDEEGDKKIKNIIPKKYIASVSLVLFLKMLGTQR